MKKTFEVSYELDERVKIGNATGVIRGYFFDKGGVEYKVAIWDDSKREIFYFQECELEKYVEPKPIQFSNNSKAITVHENSGARQWE